MIYIYILIYTHFTFLGKWKTFQIGVMIENNIVNHRWEIYSWHILFMWTISFIMYFLKLNFTFGGKDWKITIKNIWLERLVTELSYLIDISEVVSFITQTC